jgi:polyisoprenoid-binding protein YceI
MTKQKWKVDATHSALHVKVRHLGIANVTGTFKVFSGTVYKETDDFSDAQLSFSIDASSLDTNNLERDKHLKSVDFLNVATFPTINFEGRIKGDKALGNLTLASVTRSIEFDVDFEGQGSGRFGDIRAGFEVMAKISREDYGLVWNLVLDAGQIVVGDEIKLTASIELVREEQAA